jgi:hypothetical protein
MVMWGSSPYRSEGFLLEVESLDQLERIAFELESRGLLVNRREHSEWTAVVSRDPDGVAVVVDWRTCREGIGKETWKTLDHFLYGVGE